MALKCNNCKKITYDIDSPPCGETNCERFRPVQVLITHLSYKVNGVDTIACLGVPNVTIKSLHRMDTVNCPECIIASKQIIADIDEKYYAMKEDNNPKPKPVVESVPEEPQIVYLSQLGLPDTLIQKLQVWAVELDNMELMTYDGFVTWNETNELTDITNINSEDLQLLQLILKR